MKEDLEMTKPYRFLNRDVIKLLAMFTMLLNHMAHTILPQGTLMQEAFIDIGYFTAPTMCYFLVEGFEYTRSRKKYLIRMLLMAAVAEVPFVLAFRTPTLNMLFTLSICIVILMVNEKMENSTVKVLVITGLVILTGFCDWPYLAAAFTILFATYRKTPYMWRAYAIAFVALLGVEMADFLSVYSLQEAFLHAMFAAIPVLLSGVVTQVFYNGRQFKRGRTFFKWFFYWFYPVHLLILAYLAGRIPWLS